MTKYTFRMGSKYADVVEPPPHAKRLDAHDDWLSEIQRVISKTSAVSQRTSNNLELLSVKVDLLATKIDKLVDGMLKPAKNGGN